MLSWSSIICRRLFECAFEMCLWTLSCANTIFYDPQGVLIAVDTFVEMLEDEKSSFRETIVDKKFFLGSDSLLRTIGDLLNPWLYMLAIWFKINRLSDFPLYKEF